MTSRDEEASLSFDDRLVVAQRQLESMRKSGSRPKGYVILACSACGVGSLVREEAKDWPCPVCELLLQPFRCGSCSTAIILSRDPSSTKKQKPKSWCDTCGVARTWWFSASASDVLADVARFDIVTYGSDREASLLFPERRVIHGKILALEGVSGLAVGRGSVVLDRDFASIVVGDARVHHRFDYEAITSLQVAGRGEFVTKSGGGWVGGGFGLSAALQGAFMADVLNFLTTRKHRHVESLLHLGWTGGGLTLLNQVYPPERLAELVQPAVARLNALKGGEESGSIPTSGPPVSSSQQVETVADRIQQLDALRDQGLISADEYRDQRARILSEI